jgi:uncharacterized iron-regulated protein
MRIWFSFIVFIISAASVAYADNLPRYDLAVSFDVAASKISGVSKITITKGRELYFRRGPLDIRYIKINDQHVEFEQRQDIFGLTPDHDGMMEIGFEGTFYSSQGRQRHDGIAANTIDSEGISLTGLWFPILEGLSYYSLKASLPEGYEAISEAEEITRVIKDKTVEFQFDFPHPLDSINFIASKQYVIVRDTYKDVEILAYFFREDLDLARTYIEHTKKYLALYEGLLNNFPYKRFSIVENFLPTGYSMPTFTLLGSAVVRLPFIAETSLGHEILHQWFGNHVYIDYDSGNWAEGLTTYLSDHFYQVQQVKGWQYRKQILIDYGNYVTPEVDFPLREFTGRMNHSTRAIGYGKTAMLFHMLKGAVGNEVFFQALNDFIAAHRYRNASWDDIRNSFQKYYDNNLHGFFTQWLDSTGLPQLTFENFLLIQTGRRFTLSFDVNQKEKIFAISIPVSIYMSDETIQTSITVTRENQSFEFELSGKPAKIVFDENYDVARSLSRDEIPHVISALSGELQVVVLPDKNSDRYEGVIQEFQDKGARVMNAADITNEDLKNHALIVLGHDNPVIGRLYGNVPPTKAGFSIQILENPWNRDKVTGIISGESREEIDAAFYKVSHYGKYSTLLFNQGKNIAKEIEETSRGITMELYREPHAINLAKIETLTNVIDGVSKSKIVYVGEMHDVFAHHAVQLDIIAGLHRKNSNIAIGMEMFQRPYQDTLDKYIDGSMDEKEFLKRSEYFERWGFDYNLYKPILDFAKAETIPVIALNMDREIIRKVSKNGIDALEQDERDLIPARMDFTDREYRDRLHEVFEHHAKNEEKEFDNFYTSQLIWDETMSLSIDEFLQDRPDYQIVVIAGTGHLQYGSGIPKRTFRRNGHDYSIVLIDTDAEKGIADYVVYPKPVEGITTPKLMVFLKELEDKGLSISGFPENSVSEQAGLDIGDLVLSVDDVEVTGIDDIRIHLLYKRKGDVVKVRILRSEEDSEQEFVFDVTL